MGQLNPFSLRIFVADGDPDGLRVVERSNWIGKALIFPRALLPKVKQRDELGQTGVYLLLGPRDDGEGEKLYIGEATPSDRGSRATTLRRILDPCGVFRGRAGAIEQGARAVPRGDAGAPGQGGQAHATGQRQLAQ